MGLSDLWQDLHEEAVVKTGAGNCQELSEGQMVLRSAG
jgi:hypothetical protein